MGCDDMMKTIYLIGFMGSGKSTIGQELARNLHKTYVDTDQYIVETDGREITDIFRENGENTFRDFETDALKRTSTYEVISTGGGIVERNENIQIMQENGYIFYLQTSFQEIDNRLKMDASRPLWNNNIEEKLKLYNRRIHMYEKYADQIVDTDEKSIDMIIQEITECLTDE